ncbi:Photosystem II reaction center W protein-chloroplastic [Striga hermonthica]|uniref:PSII 6.1 kDa protein n=1 Tax=Striga hermonthica TaxID=68872 RepID=A0A9N7NKF0_STRHE|nr:Photosystem II reaction center W protein-chloroplastic [Striga hermonthica]
MATISACTSTTLLPRAAAFVPKASDVRPSAVHGLPSRSRKMGKVRCSMERKPNESCEPNMGMAASLAAACVAAMSSPAAMALVDERMSTEGTGLPFGLSNNLLGWILFGVFGLIWAFYFIYVSSLEEDEESGLSL